MGPNARASWRLLAIAALTFAALGLRLTAGPGFTPIMLAPTLLTGVWFGRAAGALSGALGVALLGAADALHVAAAGTPLGLLVRLLGYAAAGYTVGWVADQRRRVAQTAANQAAALTLLEGCLITIDHSGRILDLSGMAEETFDLPRSSTLGRELADVLVPVRHRAACKEELARSLSSLASTSSVCRLLLTARRADGAEVPVELTVTQVMTREPPLFTGRLIDLTDQLQAKVAWEDLSARAKAAQNAAEDAQRRAHTLLLEALGAEQAVRQRLAETLHDGALQSLLAASQDLTEAAQGARGGLDRASSAIADTIVQLRDAVSEMHPIVLDVGGLEAALSAIARDQGRRGHYHARVLVAGNAVGIHDVLLVAVARELLTNAAKHANAHHVLVTVSRRGSDVVLQVSDDGRGMNATGPIPALERGHVGLASSANRVAAAGGTLKLSSIPNSGTAVRVVLPAGDLRRHHAKDSSTPDLVGCEADLRPSVTAWATERASVIQTS